MQFGDSLFNINGEEIDYSTWAEGNKACPTSKGQVERFPEPAFNMKSASLVITPYADNRRKSFLKQFHILKQVGAETQEITLPTGEECQEVTPYLHCSQCEESYHGAPTSVEGEKWSLPRAVGTDYLRPDKKERKDGKQGGYNPTSKWHFTLPLYDWVADPATLTIENAIKKDPAAWKQMFPQKVIDWLLAGKIFKPASPSPSSEEDKEVEKDA